MKSLVVLLAVLGLAAACRAQPPAAELRQALAQYHPGGAQQPPSSPPRQLSPGERAELRRQLAEHGQPRRTSTR